MEGRMELALEIQRLVPSFGRKLNPDGFVPLDLALQWGHPETVRAMIKLEPELISVHGGEGITPLHYAAEINDVDMLAKFLISCPDSIERVTVRRESAVHVAVKNGKLAAFRVLLGWLKRTGNREVLRWRDWEGNTALHLAASTNQPQVMELLIKEGMVRVNAKNSRGLTALGIVMELPTEVNGRALQILGCKRARRGSSISDPKISFLADYLSSNVTIRDRIIKFTAYLEVGVPGEIRSTVLVVAVLIAAAAYQALLHPPDAFRDQTPLVVNITSIPHNSSTTTTSFNVTSNVGVDVLKNLKADNGNGEKVIAQGDINNFFVMNSISLAASLGTIASLLPTRPYSLLLNLSLLFLMLSFTPLMGPVTSPFVVTIGTSIILMSFCLSNLLLVVKLGILSGPNMRGFMLPMGSKKLFKHYLWALKSQVATNNGARTGPL